MRKIYGGPFGNYEAGTGGAVLNACVRQEGRPLTVVENYVIGSNGNLYKDHGAKVIAATYVWDGDEIVFDWKTA